MEHQELEREILESQKQRDGIRKDYESRISEIKKTNAQQCNDLCQEVIEANREIARLRKELADQSTRNKSLSLREVFETVVFLGCAFFRSTRSGIISRQGVHTPTNRILLRGSNVRETNALAPADSGSETGFFSVNSQNDSIAIKSVISVEEEELSDLDVGDFPGELDAEIEAETNSIGAIHYSQEQDEAALSVHEKCIPKSTRGISWVRRRIAKLGSKIKRHTRRKKKNKRKDKEPKRNASLERPTQSAFMC